MGRWYKPVAPQAACGLRRATGLRRAPRCQRGDQGRTDPSLSTT